MTSSSKQIIRVRVVRGPCVPWSYKSQNVLDMRYGQYGLSCPARTRLRVFNVTKTAAASRYVYGVTDDVHTCLMRHRCSTQ